MKRDHSLGREANVDSRLEERCCRKGLKMTEQRRTICRVLSEAGDHPDVETIHRRASEQDYRLSLATVYRTVKLLEAAGILIKHEFEDGHARYEEATVDHHDHLVDVDSGEVIEFSSDEIERLQEIVAEQLGYRLIGHRLQLYGVKIKP